MNLKYTVVMTLLASALFGAAQTQAGTVNKGSGGYLSTGIGGAGGAAGNNAQFYTAVLRAGATITCPAILGTARFTSDTNTTTTSAKSGYVNLSSGGALLSGNVNGAFTPTSSSVVASYAATNTYFDAITGNALIGTFVVFIGGSIDATGTTIMTNSANPYNAVVMTGAEDPTDRTLVSYTTTNVNSSSMESIVYRK